MLLLRFYKKEKLEEILNAETPEESDWILSLLFNLMSKNPNYLPSL